MMKPFLPILIQIIAFFEHYLTRLNYFFILYIITLSPLTYWYQTVLLMSLLTELTTKEVFYLPCRDQSRLMTDQYYVYKIALISVYFISNSTSIFIASFAIFKQSEPLWFYYSIVARSIMMIIGFIIIGLIVHKNQSFANKYRSTRRVMIGCATIDDFESAEERYYF